MLRAFTCALVFASAISAAAHAQWAGHPSTITVQAFAQLPRAAEASRVHLLGLEDVYSLAIYVDGGVVDRARLLSSSVAKALRIDIRYEEDLHRRITLDWRRELVPRLDAAATAHLQGTFAALTPGDVLLIEYVPKEGTTVRVNKTVAVGGANHELMLAFLDHWIGQRPVSEEIKRTLLGGG